MIRSIALCTIPMVAALGLAAPASAQVARPGAMAAVAGASQAGAVQQVRWRGGWHGGFGHHGFGHHGFGHRGFGYGGFRHHGFYGHRGFYGPRYGYGYGYGGGAGLAAGLATGVIVGGALAASQAPYYAGRSVYSGPSASTVAYCQQKFKSYDVNSGTYLGYDGERHSCP